MKHIDWIRTLPCHCGDNTSTEAAHLRYSCYKSGKSNPGKGAKPSDLWLTPLCSYHHRMQHQLGEKTFWNNFGIDPITYCILLKANSGDINKLPEIIETAKNKWNSDNGLSAILRLRPGFQRSKHNLRLSGNP